MSSKNDLAWPETEHFVAEVCQQLDVAFALGGATAAQNLLTDAVVIAAEKIDGTNFGIGQDGALFGRRFRIEPHRETYQKVPLNIVSAINSSDVLAHLRDAVGDVGVPDPIDFRLYGELGCNQMYSYKDKGFVNAWHCFGAVLRLANADDHQQWKDALREARFWFQDAPGRADVIVVISCPAFVEVLSACNVPHARIAFEGTLIDLVAHRRDWMMSGDGEGLVVSLLWPGRHSGQARILKWKMGHEPAAPSAILALQTTVAMLDRYPADVSLFLTTLHDVMHNGAPETVTYSRRIRKAKFARANEFDNAMASAATKLDSPDAYFAKGRAGLLEYIRCVADEVLLDHPHAPADKVQSYVSKRIGKLYGKWLKSSNQQ
ncbi:RNA ligase domain-containing protein [Plasmodiophora brassicae]